MLALLVKYTWTMASDSDCWEDNITWVFYVVEQAEAADINLSGPAEFAEILMEIKDKASKQTAASRPKWTSGTFTKKVCWLLASISC